MFSDSKIILSVENKRGIENLICQCKITHLWMSYVSKATIFHCHVWVPDSTSLSKTILQPVFLKHDNDDDDHDDHDDYDDYYFCTTMMNITVLIIVIMTHLYFIWWRFCSWASIMPSYGMSVCGTSMFRRDNDVPTPIDVSWGWAVIAQPLLTPRWEVLFFELQMFGLVSRAEVPLQKGSAERSE